MMAFTLVHVLISLAAIASGFVVVFGFLSAKRLDRLTLFFLTTTVATSVTGFFFPVAHLMPSHVVGLISLAILAVAIAARYRFHLVGASRWIYVVGAIAAQYFDFFVLIVQSFAKIPALKMLAPTQSEPPFKVTQLVALVLFIVLGVFAVRKFHPPVDGSMAKQSGAPGSALA